MKITPTKDYKKPLYALGLATAMIAVAVTGCTDPDSKTKSRRHNRNTKHTEVQYEGGLTIADPDVELMGETDVYIPPTTENIQFEGEMDIWTDPTDEDFGMDGNVLVGPDYTVEDTQ